MKFSTHTYTEALSTHAKIWTSNVMLWLLFGTCQMQGKYTNCYDKYATITSSLLLWFIYYSHSKKICVAAKIEKFCPIIQWCVH